MSLGLAVMLIACTTAPPQAPTPQEQPPASPTPARGATLDGIGADAFLSMPGHAWTVVGQCESRGSMIWWNRETGVLGNRIEPCGPADVTSEDTVWVLVDGRFQIHSPKAAPVPAWEAAPILDVRMADYSDLILLRRSDEIEVRDRIGERVWSHKGPIIDAAWVGDRVVFAEETSIWEAAPALGRLREIGKLPEEKPGRTWHIGPSGGWSGVEADSIVQHMPGEFSEGGQGSSIIIPLDYPVHTIAWLDPSRLLILNPEGIFLYQNGKNIALEGDLLSDAKARTALKP